MITVAILTTPVARHELYRTAGQYRIITTQPGHVPSELMRREFGRVLTTLEAVEWCDTTKRCGGVVREREIVR